MTQKCRKSINYDTIRCSVVQCLKYNKATSDFLTFGLFLESFTLDTLMFQQFSHGHIILFHVLESMVTVIFPNRFLRNYFTVSLTRYTILEPCAVWYHCIFETFKTWNLSLWKSLLTLEKSKLMIFNILYIVVLHFFGQVTKDTLSQHILLHNLIFGNLNTNWLDCTNLNIWHHMLWLWR